MAILHKAPYKAWCLQVANFKLISMTFSPFIPHAYPMAFQIPIMVVVVVRITHLKYFKEGDCVTITKSLFKIKSKIYYSIV